MAIIKRRDQIVLFRLTKDEYDALRTLCEERDAASISSFARSEILKVLDRDNPLEISQQLSSLQRSVQRIIQMLDGTTEPTSGRSQGQKRLRS